MPVMWLSPRTMTIGVFVDNAGRRMPEIEAALQAQGMAVTGLRRIEPRMEEAFVSLMLRERRQGRGPSAAQQALA